MKIVDARDSWTVIGMHVATFPANEVVNDRAMLAYYEAYPGHSQYEPLRKALPFDRYVILTEQGRFIIVPMNPSLYTVVEA